MKRMWFSKEEKQATKSQISIDMNGWSYEELCKQIALLEEIPVEKRTAFEIYALAEYYYAAWQEDQAACWLWDRVMAQPSESGTESLDEDELTFDSPYEKAILHLQNYINCKEQIGHANYLDFYHLGELYFRWFNYNKTTLGPSFDSHKEKDLLKTAKEILENGEARLRKFIASGFYMKDKKVAELLKQGRPPIKIERGKASAWVIYNDRLTTFYNMIGKIELALGNVAESINYVNKCRDLLIFIKSNPQGKPYFADPYNENLFNNYIQDIEEKLLSLDVQLKQSEISKPSSPSLGRNSVFHTQANPKSGKEEKLEKTGPQNN